MNGCIHTRPLSLFVQPDAVATAKFMGGMGWEALEPCSVVHFCAEEGSRSALPHEHSCARCRGFPARHPRGRYLMH